MDDNLPNDFDVIIVGTGLPESVLSGGLSRINKSVLQLDANEYYGSSWASFNIKAFDKFMSSGIEPIVHKDINLESILSEGEVFKKITPRQCINHSESRCFVTEKLTSEDISGSSPVDKNGVDNDCPTSTSKLSSATIEDDEQVQPAVSDQGDGIEADSRVETLNPDTTVGAKKITTTNPISSDISEKSISDSNTVDHKDEVDDTDVSKSSENVNVNNDPQFKQNIVVPKMSPLEEFYDQWRRFNIDLTSKVMFSRGLLVELLIQSNVSRYLEFRSLSRLLTLLSGEEGLQPVPCSRADVFKSKFVNVVQKRILMRVLTMCSNYEKHEHEYEAFKDKTFAEFLQSKKLSEKAQHFVIHSIAMVTKETMTLDGLKSTKRFLHSLGRYGNSAFLFPLYGVGELPQAFSRLSAVFGGTFCLRRGVIGVITDQETGQCKAIVDSTGQRINCRHLVLDEASVADVFQQEYTSALPRAVYVTDKSVTTSSSEEMSLITFPSTDSHDSIRVIELSPSCYVCPAKKYLLHAQAKPTNSIHQSPKEIFASVEKDLFCNSSTDKSAQSPSCDEPDEATANATVQDSPAISSATKPRVLWSAYFNMVSGGVKQADLPRNMFVMKGPDSDLGFDLAVEEARRVFEVICPEEEFLPRAPEPDEIIFNDEGYNTEKNDNSSESQEENDGEYADREDDLQEEGSSEPPQDDAIEQPSDKPAEQNDDQT